MNFQIREAKPEEFPELGQLLVDVYANIDGFPSKHEQPDYYDMLFNIGQLTEKSSIKLFIAVSETDNIAGGVVYIGDMIDYGSGGSATQEKNAAGFRLLAVDPRYRGHQIGKRLSEYCIQTAREQQVNHLVIHSTESMKVAWKMYERMGFQRALDLDFMQDQLPVFGFRLQL